MAIPPVSRDAVQDALRAFDEQFRSLPEWENWEDALAIEESGGPDTYVLGLRCLAERLETLRWWLCEPPTNALDT